jgi:hypothetical protein
MHGRRRVAVGPFARPWPLVNPPPRRKPLPPTQVVRPPFFDNKNEFYAPLVQVVPTAERMLSDKVTSAEIKHVLEANAKALRHRGKPTTLGYGTDWATIQELAAKRLRVKSEQLKAQERDRPAKKNQLRREWDTMAAKFWKDDRDAPKIRIARRIAAKIGGSPDWIARHISKK